MDCWDRLAKWIEDQYIQGKIPYEDEVEEFLEKRRKAQEQGKTGAA